MREPYQPRLPLSPPCSVLVLIIVTNESIKRATDAVSVHVHEDRCVIVLTVADPVCKLPENTHSLVFPVIIECRVVEIDCHVKVPRHQHTTITAFTSVPEDLNVPGGSGSIVPFQSLISSRASL